VAVANFLVFIIAISGAIWCCRRLVRTRRLLSAAKRHAVSPNNFDINMKSLNTVHALNEIDVSKQNEDYYNETVKKLTPNEENVIVNSDADVELRMSHSAQMS